MKRWLFLAWLLGQAARADTPVVQGTDHAHGRMAGGYTVTGPEQGYQGPIRLLDPETGRYVGDWSLSGTLNGCAVDPQGRWMAVDVAGSPDELRVYSLEDGRLLGKRVFESYFMEASPDGKVLACLTGTRVTLMDRSLRTLASWEAGPSGRGGISFLDGQRVVAGTEVFNLQGKRLGHHAAIQRSRYRVEPGTDETPLTILQGDKTLVEVMGAADPCFSQAEDLVAVPNRNLDVYSLPGGELVHRFEGLQCQSVTFVGPWLLGEDKEGAGFVAHSRAGVVHRLGPSSSNGRCFWTKERLGVGDREGVQVFDPRQGVPIAVLPRLTLLEGSEAPDERAVLGFCERAFACFSLQDGKELWKVPIPAKSWKDDEQASWGKVVWSRDSSRALVVVEINQPLSAVLQSSDGKLVKRFSESYEALSADGRWVADSRQEVSLDNLKTNKIQANSAYAIPAYSPSGEWLALYGNQGITLLRRGQVALRQAFAKPVDVAAGVWSADNRWLALACPASGRNGGGLAHLVDLRKLRSIPLPSPDRLSAFVFSRDSRWLLSGGSSQQYAGLWDLSGPRLVRQFRPQEGEWEGFDSYLSPDGRVVLFNLGRQLAFYDRASGRKLGGLFLFGKDWLVTTPGGAYDGSPGGIERLCLRGATFRDVTSAAQRPDLHRPGLLARILAGG